MRATLLLLCLFPLAVPVAPEASADGQASTQTFVPSAQAALDFNAKAKAAGLFPTNTPTAGAMQSANGSMGVSLPQGFPSWGWNVYSLLDMGFSNFPYATQAYSPATEGTKKLYLCSVNDEARGVRATGVAIYMDNSPWPSRCAVAAKAQNGALSIKFYGVQFGLGPPILINPKGMEIYQWYDAFAGNPTNLWKCGDDVGPPPHPFTCPFVMGNYPEPWISPAPIRRHCRFPFAGKYVYGWTDARYQNGIKDRICYAVRNPTAASAATMRIVTSTTNFQILGFIPSFLSVSSRGILPNLQCGKYRMQPNYPSQYWPGMFSKDMLEGTFNYASSAAMCAYNCATTPGCKGVTYTARFGWCWFKVSANFGPQKLNGRDVGAVTLPDSPPQAAPYPMCPNPVTTLEYMYGTIFPSSMMAPMTAGPSCPLVSNKLYPQRDWLYCGILQAAYAESIAQCCQLVLLYNQGKPRSAWSYAFSFKRGYNQCFLRGGPAGQPNTACNDATGDPNLSHQELQAVSGRLNI